MSPICAHLDRSSRKSVRHHPYRAAASSSSPLQPKKTNNKTCVLFSAHAPSSGSAIWTPENKRKHRRKRPRQRGVCRLQTYGMPCKRGEGGVRLAPAGATPTEKKKKRATRGYVGGTHQCVAPCAGPIATLMPGCFALRRPL